MMKIDLTCPVEAWRVELPTEEKRSCEVTLFNLSSMQVVSVEVTPEDETFTDPALDFLEYLTDKSQ